MNKVICREPAFLRDIHRVQVLNYNETKSMKISERINYILEKAERQARKMGYHVIKGRG